MNNIIYSFSEQYSLFKEEPQKRFFLFNITEGSIFRLNEISYYMLSLFDGKRRVCEILQILLDRYDVKKEKLETDLGKMLPRWVEKNILIRKENS